MPGLDETRARLEARLADLTKEAREIDAELREPDSADAEDRATEQEGDEVLERLGESALQESTDIRNALKRIEIGTYGTCTACGDPVGEKRLEAIPWAAKCINCAGG
jgi:RNA polymerase-binding protein DksA